MADNILTGIAGPRRSRRRRLARAAARAVPDTFWHSGGVVGPLVAALVAGGLALAVLGAVLAGLDKVPGRVVLGLAVLLEIVVVVQAGWAVAGMLDGRRPAEFVTFVLYLLGIVVVLPLVVAWSLAERTRWSNLVVAVGALTVMAMAARLDQLWRGTGG